MYHPASRVSYNEDLPGAEQWKDVTPDVVTNFLVFKAPLQHVHHNTSHCGWSFRSPDHAESIALFQLSSKTLDDSDRLTPEQTTIEFRYHMDSVDIDIKVRMKKCFQPHTEEGSRWQAEPVFYGNQKWIQLDVIYKIDREYVPRKNSNTAMEVCKGGCLKTDLRYAKEVVSLGYGGALFFNNTIWVRFWVYKAWQMKEWVFASCLDRSLGQIPYQLVDPEHPGSVPRVSGRTAFGNVDHWVRHYKLEGWRNRDVWESVAGHGPCPGHPEDDCLYKTPRQTARPLTPRESAK